MLKLQVRDQLMMRNKIRQILWLLCCLPVLTGCIGEDDYANDPRVISNNYGRSLTNSIVSWIRKVLTGMLFMTNTAN